MKALRAAVKAERYLILWYPTEAEYPQIVASLGFDESKLFVSEALSLSLLQQAARTGESCWSDETLLENGSLTFVLAGIKSFLCVAVRYPNGTGILYVDDRKVIGRFHYTDFANVLNLGRRLANPTAANPSAASSRVRSLEVSAAAVGSVRLPLRLQVSFFRTMATFLQSGIPLLHGLNSLAEQGEGPLRDYCRQLHKALLRGNPFSESCRKLGGFSPIVLHMLLCAERSGQLAEVLATLAQFLEDSHSRRQHLIQAMVYPMVVLSACLALAVVLPTFVLRDQLQAYVAQGPLPLPTQLLVWVGDAARSPFPWVALLLGILALPSLLRRITAREWGFLHRLLLNNPVTRRLYCARQEVTLATTLQMQLRAGVPLLEALQGSLEACDSPLIEVAAVLEKARQGQTLAQTMRGLPGLGRSFCPLLVAGEETGHAVQTLEWISRSAKLEYDLALDTALRLVEPVMMVLMGLVVGVVTLGTLLPSLRLLEV